MVNKVTLVGNLGGDPEVRQTKSGNVCNLRIATSHGKKAADGSWSNETEWHTVVVFGRDADNCQKFLAKGRQVYIEGRIQSRDYVNRDGQNRRSFEIVANRVVFLSSERSEPRKAAPARAEHIDDDIPF